MQNITVCVEKENKCRIQLVKQVRYHVYFFLKCIIKQLLNLVFVICGVIKVSVSVITYLDLDNSVITKTSSNIFVYYCTWLSLDNLKYNHIIQDVYRL